jgi:hypothetical protein
MRKTRSFQVLTALIFTAGCAGDATTGTDEESRRQRPDMSTVTDGGTSAPPDLASGTNDGGGGGIGGGGAFSLNGVTFPWQIFDGTVPDVSASPAPYHTYYCDPIHGNDSWDGTSFTFVSGTKGPKKSLNGALALSLAAGDTILLGGGVYRERPSVSGHSGKAGLPITIGSYGHGTGAPVLDGGIKPNTWTRYTAQGQTTVWQSSTTGLAKITSTQPVLGVYVNSGTTESALREVYHGQLDTYGSDPMPAKQTQANIGDNSNKWYYDATAQVLYADFGGSLGGGDPNAADISILYNSHANSNAEPLIELGQGTQYLTFRGLTLRAGSWDGVYSEASNITFDHCDVKFNGGAGIAFAVASGDLSVTGNSVTYTRIWMNVLDNWPRFNNHNTGGGWPGSLTWYSQSNGLSQGNVVYQNGGEGQIFWGTEGSGSTVHTSTNNVARNDVIFDNFSVNVYFDNTQNARFEQSFVFSHPRDPSQTFDNLFTTSNGYNTDWGKKITPILLSLADEPGSAFDSKAHLSNITVVNNIFAGAKFGFLDYDDGTSTVHHGLKSCNIENNTWVLGSQSIPGQDGYGWRHLFGGSDADTSSNSFIENNIFVASSGDRFLEMGLSGAGPGITNDYNLYSGPGVFFEDSSGTSESFSAWKSAHPSWDQHSQNAGALLTDATEFSQTVGQKLIYDWSKATPQTGSPAVGAGVNLSSSLATDFSGSPRANAAYTLGAITR